LSLVILSDFVILSEANGLAGAHGAVEGSLPSYLLDGLKAFPLLTVRNRPHS
jgi:hypothetical protein